MDVVVLTDADLVARLGRPVAARLTRLPVSLPDGPTRRHGSTDDDPVVDALLDDLLGVVLTLGLEPVNPRWLPFTGDPPVRVACHQLPDGRRIAETVSPVGEHVFGRSPAGVLEATLDGWASCSDGPLTVLATSGERLRFCDHDGSWALRPDGADGPAAGAGLTSAAVVAALG